LHTLHDDDDDDDGGSGGSGGGGGGGDDDDDDGIKITWKVKIFRTILLQQDRSNTMRQNMHISEVRSGKE
jgi:hypothetical protein